jgi:hypothetical protein
VGAGHLGNFSAEIAVDLFHRSGGSWE